MGASGTAGTTGSTDLSSGSPTSSMPSNSTPTQ
jgi:hypothetical protein